MKPIVRMLSAEQRSFVKVPREVLSEVGVKVDKRLCWWVDLEKHLSCIIDLIYIFIKYADFRGLGVDPRLNYPRNPIIYKVFCFDCWKIWQKSNVSSVPLETVNHWHFSFRDN